MTIREELFSLRDEKYAQMQTRIVPGQKAEAIIGVRVPELRKLAKRYAATPEGDAFLKDLPHAYYDENMLHSAMLSELKDYERAVLLTDTFLPFVDNWAVCDTLSPKAFKKHRDKLMEQIRRWVASDHVYTCRFGMEMLMTHFLDADFRPEYLELPANVRSEEYYVNMMTAWFFATALAKQWDATVPYIENGRLDAWTHNKTIQKARESFRIDESRKAYLKTLKKVAPAR